MRILVTARYVSGDAKDGGSSRFMRCVADTLQAIGHEVTVTTRPGEHLNDNFDLIICSHEKLDEVKNSPVKKVFISHGIIGDEAMRPGADRYIAVSEEVRGFNMLRGITSEVIGQPIKIGRQTLPRPELKKILIIRRMVDTREDPFAFLSDRYEVRESDIDIPIEDQIEWADLCIALGRGALESMAQGKPVLIADNREYIGAKGDGYVNASNIREISRCNFSGRRFQHPLTREWIEAELAKYNPADSDFLYQYVKEHHDAEMIVNEYLAVRPDLKVSFGVMVNDQLRLNMVLQQSQFKRDEYINCHFLENPESATKGLNLLLDKIEKDRADIGILTHQDMFYSAGWIEQVKSQIAKLPDNWIIAGIVGKDFKGMIAGQFKDMRIPLDFNTYHLHEFPQPTCCIDECCIIVNMQSGFRFDETMTGFDLYGTLCILQAWDMGGSAWVLDAYAEHYCMRPFSWHPDDLFVENYKWLFDKYEHLNMRIDSTALGLPKDGKVRFETSAA